MSDLKTSSASSSYLIAGIFMCLLGAIFFSTKAIFVKLAYRDTNVDAVSLLALRMIFSLPFFLLSAFASSSQKGNKKFTTRQWISIIIVGCLGYYASSLLDFLGLQYVSAGMERLILFIYPTLVLVISSLAFGVKIRVKQWLAVLITYSGLALAFAGEVQFGESANENFYLGVVLIFVCGITFALYIVGSGRIIPEVGPAKFNSYAMSFACVGVLLHFFITSNESLFNFSASVYIYSFILAVFSTVIPSYLITEGIKRVGSNNAAIIGSIGPVSTIVQAYFFLQEPIFFLQILGTLLVLGGILLISVKPKTHVAS